MGARKYTSGKKNSKKDLTSSGAGVSYSYEKDYLRLLPLSRRWSVVELLQTFARE